MQCTYGDETAAKTIVIVGGSHASQWADAFDAIGRVDGYRVVVMSKSACTFFVADEYRTSCSRWVTDAMAAIIEMRPDLVVALVTRTDVPGRPETVPESHRRAFTKLESHGIRMLGLRDTPRLGFNAANCVSIYRDVDLSLCARPRDVLLGDVESLKAKLGPNIHFVDTSTFVCDVEFCPVVVDGVLRYRDDDHLTRTFVMQLTDELAAETKAALSEAP